MIIYINIKSDDTVKGHKSVYCIDWSVPIDGFYVISLQYKLSLTVA